MLTRKEKALLYDPYFKVIRETDQFIEVKSVNTGHCWSLFRNEYDQHHMITLYHKHKESDKYFHEHRKCRTRKEAVEEIKSHDEYVLEEARKAQERAAASAETEERHLKVYEQSGRNYKPTPTSILKGDWLKTAGFTPGDHINVLCENGKLTITAE